MPARRYGLRMAAYLRFPHLRGDTLVFVAENDVWTAPVSGGRAYRLTADDVPVGTPRLSPDGARVAWTSWREGAAEVFAADADGGSARRLTWWGGARCRGWTPSGDVLAVTAAGQPLGRLTWAWDVPVDGGAPRRREHGPLSDLALSAGSPGVLLATTRSLESAWWKRYRGGTAAKLWWDADGSGGFVRLLAGIDAQLETPMQVGERLAFLSDHEGWGNLYSVDRTGGDLRRHTDHGGPDAPAFYVRHASTDGTRVVYESAGELWIVDSPRRRRPRRLDVRLGGPRTAREPHRVTTSAWLSGATPDRTGRTSVVTVRGTVHRLTHRDGPARTLLAEPGVRARLAEPLGDDLAVWVDDADGEDALTVAPVDPRADDAPPLVRHRIGGRVLQLAAAPDGDSVALTLHDGRLLLVDLSGDEAEVRELARGADGEISGLAWSPDCAVAGLRRPRRGRHQPDRGDAPGRRRGRRGHRAAVRRPVADLHDGRPLPRLPVPAQLRPDLRPALVRPDLPGLLAPVPRAAGRPHARPVRGEPGRAAHLARRREGRRPALRPSPTTRPRRAPRTSRRPRSPRRTRTRRRRPRS